MKKLVINSERYCNLAGKSRWRLMLACGHFVTRPANRGRRELSYPRQIQCPVCKSGNATKGAEE
jgi:hypothetical protein